MQPAMQFLWMLAQRIEAAMKADLPQVVLR